jgi:hypothetical protein
MQAWPLLSHSEHCALFEIEGTCEYVNDFSTNIGSVMDVIVVSPSMVPEVI